MYEDRSVRGGNGTFEIEEFSNNTVSESVKWVGFELTKPGFTDRNIVFEILPEYPDALVSDGVDDYISVSGLPILTPDKGYTVIAKRNIIDVPINDIAFASKRKGGVGAGDYSGAFQVERIISQGNVAYNFGSTNPVTIDRMGQTTYTWQNSKQYNNQALTISGSPDSDELCIFKWASYATNTMHGALYAFFLFNRDLTTEEIEWVKTNLIETKQ